MPWGESCGYSGDCDLQEFGCGSTHYVGDGGGAPVGVVMGDSALSDVTVLDLSDNVAGAYCGRLLAGFGADVIKVEPPGVGDWTRNAGPFPDDIPHPEKSGLFLHLNAGKRSLTLDIASVEGRSILRQLAANSDVIIETYQPGHVASMGLGFDALSSANPSLVMTSITPFGQTGPYRNFSATDFGVFATSGRMYVHGLLDREPLPYAPDVIWHQVGATAAAATLGALFVSRRQGVGQRVDVSAQEALIGNVDSRVLFYEYTGVKTSRERWPGGIPQGAYPCADGYVVMGVGYDVYFRRLCEAMGMPHVAQDPRFAESENRSRNAEEFDALFIEWLMRHTKREVFALCQARKVMCAPVLTFGELMEDPQLKARGFFGRVKRPYVGSLPELGAPVKMSETPWRTGLAAPTLGEHTEEILRSSPGVEREDTAAPRRPRNGSANRDASPPLEGFLIVDMSEVWAGPMTASMLGDLGATVIKLESFPRPSLTRLTGQAIGYSGNDPDAPRPWDRSALHNMANRNKLGVTLNLKDARGMALFKNLMGRADAVLTSFTAGTSARLGVDYASIVKMNPKIVMLGMSGWGEEGPYQGHAALGSALDGFTGHHAMRGYADTDDSTTPLIQHTDATAAVTAVYAILAALHYRQRTGRGQWIDMSQVETFLHHLGGPFIDYAMNGRNPQKWGNRHPRHAPWGCYPCRGEDRWLVINVTSEKEWRALCEATGNEGWLEDGRFADEARRRANHDALDAALKEWTRQQDKMEAMKLLQAAGVPSLAVLDDEDLYRDPHLSARRFFQEMNHSVAGVHRYPGFLWDLTAVKQPQPRPPNGLGEHNDYVYGEILGLTAGEIQSLRAGGVIGEEYPSEV